MSIISCTSPRPSDRILPTSRVTSWPSSSLWRRSSSPSWRTISPRPGAVQVRHSRKASTVRAATRS
jgi:hypothetical protein